MIPWELFPLMVGAVLLAYVIKGIVGFAEGLVVLPLLLLFLDVTFVLPMGLVLFGIGNAYLAIRVRTDLDVRLLMRMAPGVIVGTILGTWALTVVDPGIIELLVALFIMGFAVRVLVQAEKETVVRKQGDASSLVVGMTGGFIDSFMGTGGPPLVMYFDHLGLEKSTFRAACVGTFIMISSTKVVTYGYSGLLNWDVVITGVLLLPVMVVGTFLGMRLHHRIDQTWMKRFVAGLLMVSGMLLFM